MQSQNGIVFVIAVSNVGDPFGQSRCRLCGQASRCDHMYVVSDVAILFEMCLPPTLYANAFLHLKMCYAPCALCVGRARFRIDVSRLPRLWFVLPFACRETPM